MLHNFIFNGSLVSNTRKFVNGGVLSSDDKKNISEFIKTIENEVQSKNPIKKPRELFFGGSEVKYKLEWKQDEQDENMYSLRLLRFNDEFKKYVEEDSMRDSMFIIYDKLEDYRDNFYKYAGGGGIGEELMGGQPNKSQKSGYKLLSVKHGDKLIVVTDNDGETKEHWVKSNNYSGYTLHYNGNQYEFANSFKYTEGGGVGDVYTLKDEEDTWYLTYIDSTHFFLSNTKEYKGSAYHIGQFRARPFYNEVLSWLKSHKGQMANGGGVAEGWTDDEMSDEKALYAGNKFVKGGGVKGSAEIGVYEFWDAKLSEPFESIQSIGELRKATKDKGYYLKEVYDKSLAKGIGFLKEKKSSEKAIATFWIGKKPSEYSKGGGLDVVEGWTDAELMEKGGGLYGDKFIQVEDYGDRQYYIRYFGSVISDKESNIELVVVAEIMDLEDAVSKDELPKEGNFQLDITLAPYEKYISAKHKKLANAPNQSISDNTIINVVSYMGGLNYEPQKKVFFKTQKDAEKYLFSKELNNQISSDGVVIGFILDKYYNRLGQRNWERLDYMTGKISEFVKGGGLEQKGKTDKAHDIVYKAKRVGYRYTDERAKKLGLSPNAKPTQEHIDKYLGNGVYKEDRANRSDKSRMKKLNRGGSAKGEL
jgi:hypothetical protein